MSDSFSVQAEIRVDEGKGASRRLRRLEGKVPGVIYGGKGAATSISLIRKDLEKMMESEAFDYLDAPMERVCGADVPMPYS